MALPKQRTTETMNAEDSRKQFSEILDRVQRDDERVVIEKDGVPVAAVVPISVLQADEEREQARQRALASLREAQAGFADVDEEEAEREIAKALEEIRQERAAARSIVSALVQTAPDLFTSSEESLVTQVTQLLRKERKIGQEEPEAPESQAE
jgi:prevent-host-death family protein